MARAFIDMCLEEDSKISEDYVIPVNPTLSKEFLPALMNDLNFGGSWDFDPKTIKFGLRPYFQKSWENVVGCME
uniref:Uncharacterized protein n=1 Tax=Romanomermis culicivorax TaxID=13658 RepID=A0A915HKF2_ROMCU